MGQLSLGGGDGVEGRWGVGEGNGVDRVDWVKRDNHSGYPADTERERVGKVGLGRVGSLYSVCEGVCVCVWVFDLYICKRKSLLCMLGLERSREGGREADRTISRHFVKH